MRRGESFQLPLPSGCKTTRSVSSTKRHCRLSMLRTVPSRRISSAPMVKEEFSVSHSMEGTTPCAYAMLPRVAPLPTGVEPATRAHTGSKPKTTFCRRATSMSQLPLHTTHKRMEDLEIRRRKGTFIRLPRFGLHCRHNDAVGNFPQGV